MTEKQERNFTQNFVLLCVRFLSAFCVNLLIFLTKHLYTCINVLLWTQILQNLFEDFCLNRVSFR